MRRVHTLVAELGRCVPKPLPGVAKIFRQVFRQCLFRGRPAVVLNALGDPLLAVETLVSLHVSDSIDPRVSFPAAPARDRLRSRASRGSTPPRAPPASAREAPW